MDKKKIIFMGGGAAVNSAGSGVAYVSAASGSNSTGSVTAGRPYATIKAAHDACVTAGGAWVVNVAPGAYTDVGMTSVLVSYYFEPNAVLTQSAGSVDCFNPTGATAVTSWGVYGHGTFIINSSGSGNICYVDSSNVGVVTFQGQSINVLASGASGTNNGAIEFFGTLTGPNNGFFNIDLQNCSSNIGNMWGLYLRGGAKYMITGGLYTNVVMDGNADVKAFINEAHKFIIGKDNFGEPTLRIFTNRGLKGSDGGPALTVRTGKVTVVGGCVYSGGGAPSSSQATILEINSASGTEAATVKVFFNGCIFSNWGNGGSSATSSGSGPMIRYPAFAGAKVTLISSHMISGAINATTAMVTSTGGVPQTLYIGGGGTTSNVPVSADITTVGAPFTVNTAFPDVIDYP